MSDRSVTVFLNKTDALRGYLCRNCNLGLGNFHDDSTLIRQAAAYLVQDELKDELREA